MRVTFTTALASRWFCSAIFLLAGCFSLSLSAAEPGQASYLGRPIAAVIDEFRAAGYPFAYSTGLVRSNFTVTVEPSTTKPLEIVREILAPWHLEVREEQGFLLVVRAATAVTTGGSLVLIVRDENNWQLVDGVRVSSAPQLPDAAVLGSGVYQYETLEPREYRVQVEADGFEPGMRTVKVRAGKPTLIEVELVAKRDEIEMITVLSSRYDIWSDIGSSPFFISGLSIENLPDIGDDPLRAAQVLPGTASTGVSAQTYIRGGEYRETAVFLNGNELLDPYHSRDFQSIFSTVDSRIIDGIEVYTGGVPLRFGDQMSGALLMTTIDPAIVQRNEIGVSVYNTSLLMSGMLESGRGGWLVSARRGNLDLVIKPEFGSPKYHDIFASFRYELSPDATLTANALYAKDKISLILADDLEGHETASSNAESLQFWVQLHNQWSDDLRSTSLVSLNAYESKRYGEVDDVERYVSTVTDTREFQELKLQQDWEWGYADKHILQWGFDLAYGGTEYAYFSDTSYFGLSTLYPGTPANEIRDLEMKPEGGAYAIYLADKWQIAQRTFVDYGLRFDQQNYDEQTFATDASPRVHFFHATQGGTEFRASWGRFLQPQDLRELQIEDGVIDFYRAQRADQVVVGVRQPFGANYSLRLELYQKEYDRLRPRYENLYNQLALIPEVEPDRLRIAPTSARARGAEVMLDSESDGPWSWRIAYSYSEVEDNVDDVDIPRGWDQRQTLRAGLNWSTDRWDVGISTNIHDGWPTTSLSLVETVDENGLPAYVAEPGPRNAGHYSMYATLDARVNRKFRFGDQRVLNVFLEISNALNRENPCCVEFDLDYDENDIPFVVREEDFWLPVLPALGFIFEF
jgi:outer membrane receptor protein involved in Fe transport